MKKSKLITKTIKDYEMMMAGRLRRFEYVVLAISPNDGAEMMSSLEYERLFDIVTKEILSSSSPMTGPEADFLTNRIIKKNYTHLSQETNIPIEEIREWRNLETPLSDNHSQLVKIFFVENIDWYNFLKIKQNFKKNDA